MLLVPIKYNNKNSPFDTHASSFKFLVYLKKDFLIKTIFLDSAVLSIMSTVVSLEWRPVCTCTFIMIWSEKVIGIQTNVCLSIKLSNISESINGYLRFSILFVLNSIQILCHLLFKGWNLKYKMYNWHMTCSRDLLYL